MEVEMISGMEILVHRKTETCLITKLVKKKYGSLEGYFTNGKLYRLTMKEMINSGMAMINKIIADPQDDYLEEKSEYEKMALSEIKQYKRISLVVSQDDVSFSPYGRTDRYGGAVGKYTIKINLPIGNNTFGENLQKVLKDAD
jgi:hypothetical protein